MRPRKLIKNWKTQAIIHTAKIARFLEGFIFDAKTKIAKLNKILNF